MTHLYYFCNNMAKNEETDTAQKAKESKTKKTSFRKIFFLNLLGMGLIAAVMIAASLAGLHKYTRHGEEIDVPNLKGLTVSQAIDRLQKIGLIAKIDDSVYVKNQIPNTIYNQSITAGSHVKVGRIIKLTVNSSQPPMISMPDIADNSSVREATMKLTVLGLKLTAQEYINGEKDWVYAVKINGRNVTAGERIPSDSRVTLVVGDGTYFDTEEYDDYGLEADSAIVTGEYDFGSDTEPL